MKSEPLWGESHWRRGGEKEGEMERERVRGGGWDWPRRARVCECVNMGV